MQDLFTPEPVIMYSAVFGKMEKFRFFMSIVLADAVASNPLTGMRNHSNVRGCRYCMLEILHVGDSCYLAAKSRSCQYSTTARR
jgi:hypothetical protein